MLKEIVSIQTLILYDNCISDDVTFIMEGLTLNHTLLHLNISIYIYIYEYIGNNLKVDEGAGHIGEGLSQNSTLLHLDLSHNYISKEGAEKLAKGLAKNNTLVILNLGILINI